MVSKNERYRLERMFDGLRERNARQKQALTRLALANTEAVAALAEISEISKESHRPHEWENACARASTRAQEALDRMTVMAAAIDGDQEESEQSPTEDGDTEEESTDGSN